MFIFLSSVDKTLLKHLQKEGILYGIMESSLPINTITTISGVTQEKNQQNQQMSVQQTQDLPVAIHKKNIYPSVRHTLLIACVLLTFCIIIFLIHQNGKSIYENGI